MSSISNPANLEPGSTGSLRYPSLWAATLSFAFLTFGALLVFYGGASESTLPAIPPSLTGGLGALLPINSLLVGAVILGLAVAAGVIFCHRVRGPIIPAVLTVFLVVATPALSLAPLSPQATLSLLGATWLLAGAMMAVRLEDRRPHLAVLAWFAGGFGALVLAPEGAPLALIASVALIVRDRGWLAVAAFLLLLASVFGFRMADVALAEAASAPLAPMTLASLSENIAVALSGLPVSRVVLVLLVGLFLFSRDGRLRLLAGLIPFFALTGSPVLVGFAMILFLLRLAEEGCFPLVFVLFVALNGLESGLAALLASISN